MTESSWEHFEHEADIGVRGNAATLEAAFEQAAMALMAVITDPDNVRDDRTVDIECQAPDTELLLVDWLNALIYEMAVNRMLFCGFKVSIKDNHLTGRVSGETVDVARHQPVVEIKGATYTELSVNQDSKGLWHAQCVVDV